MSIISKLIRKRYLGFVSARTVYVDDNGEKLAGKQDEGRFLLSASIFGRSCKLVGCVGESPHANTVKGEVEAWILGGPLPDDFISHEPVPETNEPRIVLKEGNILSFPNDRGEQG